MSRSSAHALVAVLVVAAICCTSWSRPAPAGRALLDKGPSRARVTLADGSHFVIQHPRVERDSLFGDTLAPAVWGRLGTKVQVPVAIPLVAIDSVSIRQFDGTLTAVAAAAGMALIVVAVQSIDVGPQVSGGSTCQGSPMD